MNSFQLLTPQNWTDYELIDSGNFEKLERFGAYILARPEPQAVWNKSLDETEWTRRADATFKRARKTGENEAGEKGEWTTRKGMPGQWFVSYRYKELNLRMRLGLTAFKHVGLFPEQAENWNFIYDTLKAARNNEQPNVLNLFAYTGGASLVARAAGADVTHVDSVRQVITWSNENRQASEIGEIRWMVEDAMKFVQREVRRGRKYNGIILDPPKYGRGPDGEKWYLEEQINDLLTLCGQLLKPEQPRFAVLNLYSMGFSALVADNLMEMAFKNPPQREYGELYLADSFAKKLPLGVFARFADI